ncbi:hypothetical protein HMPREF3227_01501 [Corynebacterium sp. CMW7794]|nr:hypothetical protein HMPREF3227_01501 [Corynebacterium sp. CMW7794]
MLIDAAVCEWRSRALCCVLSFRRRGIYGPHHNWIGNHASETTWFKQYRQLGL